MDTIDIRVLQNQLDELLRSNAQAQRENALYESYKLRRLKPAEVDEVQAEIDAEKARKKLKVTAKGPKAPSFPAELTLDQKVTIATAEAEASKKDTKQMLSDAQKTFDMLGALLQQTDLRTVELKKEAHEFRRDVVLAGENPRNGTVMAEKVVSYYEDMLRHKDNVIDKLRLKVAGLKQQEAAVEKTLSQKEDVGDVLHYIDFHQLQIENNQATSALEDKNTELMRLKLTTGATVGSLNALKSRLSALVKQATQLKADITARRQLCVKLREENGSLNIVVEKSKALHDTLVVQARSARDMPQPLDYVELTRTQAVLNKELAQWARKVEIAGMAAGRSTIKVRHAAEMGEVGEEELADLDAMGLHVAGERSGSSSSIAGGLYDEGASAAYSRAAVTQRVVGGLPGSDLPVSFGSTTAVRGATGVRHTGGVAGGTKRDTRPGEKPPVRAVLPTLTPGVAGFPGALTRHTVAAREPAGPAAGTLHMGRPLTLEEQERRKAKALATAILGKKTFPAGPFLA